MWLRQQGERTGVVGACEAAAGEGPAAGRVAVAWFPESAAKQAVRAAASRCPSPPPFPPAHPHINTPKAKRNPPELHYCC